MRFSGKGRHTTLRKVLECDFLVLISYILCFICINTVWPQIRAIFTKIPSSVENTQKLIIYLLYPIDKDMEEKALSSLGTAQKKIKLEIQDLSERVKLARESTQKLKEQIEQAESTDNG